MNGVVLRLVEAAVARFVVGAVGRLIDHVRRKMYAYQGSFPYVAYEYCSQSCVEVISLECEPSSTLSITAEQVFVSILLEGTLT